MSPVCRHFGACGGCSLQHLEPEAYLAGKQEQILQALAGQGITNAPIREIVQLPPCSRRRATLKLAKRSEGAVIGFYAPRSHELIDIRECHVLTPGLFDVAQGLRCALGAVLTEGEACDVYIVEAENGFDLSIDRSFVITPQRIGHIATVAAKLNLVRVTAGGVLLYESGTPELQLGNARVKLPPGAFLQPTREGEAILQARVIEALGKAKKVVDLFCGCGTFTLKVAEKARVHAVDTEASMLAALAAAARTTSGLRPVRTERRDLFAVPLTAMELNSYEAAVLDPPRAGALAQAKQLARSRLPRIAYVSCDAASFARDARVLLDAGYALEWIAGVDQFLWSAHIELVAALTRR